MKKEIKTKHIIYRYRFIEIDTWKSVKEQGLVARFMKDKDRYFQVEDFNTDAALLKWWKEYRYYTYVPKSCIKERLKVDGYNVVLFSCYRGSRGKSWFGSSTVSQKMVMIEFT